MGRQNRECFVKRQPTMMEVSTDDDYRWRHYKGLQYSWQHSLSRHNTHKYLVHGERLHLSLQNLHPCCCHHRADIWYNSIWEYFINKPMVSKIASICHMLHRITIILVCNKSPIHFNKQSPNGTIFPQLYTLSYNVLFIILQSVSNIYSHLHT